MTKPVDSEISTAHPKNEEQKSIQARQRGQLQYYEFASVYKMFSLSVNRLEVK